MDEVTDLIIQPDAISDQNGYAELNKEYFDLKDIVAIKLKIRKFDNVIVE